MTKGYVVCNGDYDTLFSKEFSQSMTTTPTLQRDVLMSHTFPHYSPFATFFVYKFEVDCTIFVYSYSHLRLFFSSTDLLPADAQEMTINLKKDTPFVIMAETIFKICQENDNHERIRSAAALCRSVYFVSNTHKIEYHYDHEWYQSKAFSKAYKEVCSKIKYSLLIDKKVVILI